MVLSHVPVLLEVEHGGAIKRWLSTAVLPPGAPSAIDVSGEALVVEAGRRTRLFNAFSADGVDTKGKICVCDAFDDTLAEDAVQFSASALPRALLLGHEPDVAVAVPTILISREDFRYIKGFPHAVISAVYMSGSYSCINVSLKAQRMSGDDNPLEFQGKMAIPTSMIEKTVSGLEFKPVIDAATLIFRNDRGIIADGDDRFSGKVCLFNATHPSDPSRAIEVATTHGASAAFICSKDTPDWSSLMLTLPALSIDRDTYEGLKKAGAYSTDLGVTISYDVGTLTGEARGPGSSVPKRSQPPKEAPGRDATYAAAAQRGRNNADPPSYQTKDPPQSKGFLGGVVDSVKKTIFGYSPKSKEEFNAIIRKGTNWSYDGRDSASFRDAMNILGRVRKVQSPDDREAEVKLLIEAVREMTAKPGFVGDVLVLSFCAHLFILKERLRIHVLTSDLANAMVAIVNEITIDPDAPKLQGYQDKDNLDERLSYLARHLSNQQSNISKHSEFVLHALWIRTYHCGILREGAWKDLEKVTSLKYIEKHRETILTFMGHARFNTLIVSVAHDIVDICRIFGHGVLVPILPAALKKIQDVYGRNKWNERAWMEKFDRSRETAVLQLVGQLSVRDRDETAKKPLIATVIKRASFDSVRTFQELDDIYSSLAPHHQNYDMIAAQIRDSLCSSLRKRGLHAPSPKDVCDVLQSEVGCLLAEKKGWDALTSFAGANASKKGVIELFGHIHHLFLRNADGVEGLAISNDLADAIAHCINSSDNRNAFAVGAFHAASSWRDIFTRNDDGAICRRLAKLIIFGTGLASSIRNDPSMFHDLWLLRSGASSGPLLIDCLFQELDKELTVQCSSIEAAVLFCTGVSSSDARVASLDSLASDIIINGFFNWNPTNMEDLLKVDSFILRQAHTILSSITEGEDARHIRGKSGANAIKSIVVNWTSCYNNDGFDARELNNVLDALSKRKRHTLREISGGVSFPSKPDLEGKIGEIASKFGDICSMLTVHSQENGVPCSHTILDLAKSYRIDAHDGSILSNLISKYFCHDGPCISLSALCQDCGIVNAFLEKHGRELQAAAYFLSNKSVLFQRQLGKWIEIGSEEFLEKISLALNHFATLFSPNASFSVISMAADAVQEEGADAELELGTVTTCPHLAISDNALVPILRNVMELATIRKPLDKFVDCCKIHKFLFATNDSNFSELATICGRLFGEGGLDLGVDECYEAGLSIANILVPDTSSDGLGCRLKKCLPTLEFFDALRYCSSVFAMAKERMWFGEEGLQTFYKEWTNVSNVFKSNQSFENELLNRLEPTVRVMSAVGGLLACTSVASLMQTLQDNEDICKIDEIRLVQQNIGKVRDWFTEGIDDMAAILSRFSQVQSSGSFVLQSLTSAESIIPKRTLVLRYSRSHDSEDQLVVMAEEEIDQFVQHLSFVNHESEESTSAAAHFTDTYRQLHEIMRNQQAMIDVGFEGASSTSSKEYPVCTSESGSAVLSALDESQQQMKKCNHWLKAVRAEYRYSLLFWMDELRHISQCLLELRNMDASDITAEVPYTEKILESMARLSPAVSNHRECFGLILRHVVDLPPADNSWLEDVAKLVNRCGLFSESLQLARFQAVDPALEKKVAIHKLSCCEEMVFAAPLHVLRHIYKGRCPASFEVLDGSCSQSPAEIDLFLDRVLAFPNQTFTITSVEELPASEQELIASFLAKHSRSEEKMDLHCIQSRDTILHAPPGVEVCLWDDTLLSEEDQHSLWLQHNVIQQSHIKNLTVVCGPPGSGKTRYIRKEMNRLAASSGAHATSIYIHEDFSLSRVVSALRDKFDDGSTRNRALHICCSMARSGNASRNDLMLAVNNFFNSFLILQSVYDPSLGSCFHTSLHSYDIFVEFDSDTEDVCRSWLERYVPILSCCNNIVQPSLEYVIDEKTRRVCTYLRAYDDLSINDKFNPLPRNKRIIFVLDYSGSMEVELEDGRTALEIATDSMLSIFDSHLQLEDYVGLIRFNHEFQELIPLQRVDNAAQRNRLRNAMHSARSNPRGSTHMYTALSHAVHSLNQSCNADDYGASWIVCLTDGQSWDSDENLRRELGASSHHLNVILVGVNLDPEINGVMELLCSKYQPQRHPRNQGFFLPTSANMAAIENAFREVSARIPVSQTFELNGVMSDSECRAKLNEHLPDIISPENKLLYSFWINFLHRRVTVFDQNDDFNYNEEHDELGSSLMKVMLSESRQMLLREQNCSWTSTNHTQLIYDFSDGSPRFRLLCTNPDILEQDQKDQLNQLDLPGFYIPTMLELRKRETLDRYLSQALSVPLNEGPDGKRRLRCIDDNKFVLTLDFTLKLLNVHERVSCGVPCIMEGETGVSKTALTRMYSILVNSAQHSVASASTTEALKSILDELARRYPLVLTSEDCGDLERIRTFLQPSPQHNSDEACQVVGVLIKEACSNRSPIFAPVPRNLVDATEEVLELLMWFSESILEPTFFDINIHGSLTANDLQQKIDEARRVAQKLACMENVKVVVFLDEVNTSSVLGLLKELIVDRSLNGVLIEENIVLIAACNPVRHSIASKAKSSREIDLGRNWASGHYQVQQLPVSLELMCWDYGSLNTEQEKEFILQRILMMDEPIPEVVARGMTEVISCSHELIRALARDHIEQNLPAEGTDTEKESELRARSAVSLRDIQRVFHFFSFFRDFSFGAETANIELREAMLLAVGCVYYLRLDGVARNTFLQKLSSIPSEQYQRCHLKAVLEAAMDTLIKQTEIPVGIAITSGLKENVFMTLVCALSRVPLMIIGPPGCSKTLAVNTVTDNANGEESRELLYRTYPRLQPFHFQCSKSSTSNEVASVFDRAIQRQSNVKRSKQQCLVFMDEAGLPEEEKESLKVLHYLLEGHMSSSPDVSFVCITNHLLDAAKSNRCACLLRPEPDREELMCIAMGLLCQKHEGESVDIVCFEDEKMTPDHFCGIMCGSYLRLIQSKASSHDREAAASFGWFVHFFGLRDFLHLVIFLRRTAHLRDSTLHLSAETLIHGLERNFNGVSGERFSNVCAFFLSMFKREEGFIEASLSRFRRHPMDTLQDALTERHPEDASRYNLPRYKMIIDHTNDDSVMRLLRTSGILDSSHAFYALSGLEEGAEIERTNLVSRVKFAAQQGDKTVVMSQVESVSECFYDLFNQRFTEMQKDQKTIYFANIALAAGISRPSIIHPSFQCIVHVQSNQLDDIPAPFLNRFEKFGLSIGDILSWQLSRLPQGIRDMLCDSLTKCEELLSQMGGNDSIWSSSPTDSLKSIFISMIPSSQDIPSETNVLQARSLTAWILHFLNSWLGLDLAVEDVQQCIDTASSEFSGKRGVELRKALGTDESADQSQLKQLFLDLASDAQIDTPLSRSVGAIARYAISRHAFYRLIQVAIPEAVFLQRNCLPKEVLHAYFGSQEHFHLKSYISKILGKSQQLFMLHVHSDSCAHSLPTWKGECRSQEELVFESKIRSLVHEDPSSVEIHHLDLFKSESSVRNTIDSWASKEGAGCFVLVVDMQLQDSSKLVNFVRAHMEQLALASTKKLLVLLHYPLSCDRSSYPALFLGWNCSYLDGGVSPSHLSINSVVESVCFDDCALSADSVLDALLPKAAQYVASQVSFYSCSRHPQSVNQDLQFTERLSRVEALLERQINGESLGRILCRKFLLLWTKDATSDVLYRAAHGLKSGRTRLSLSTAVRTTFQAAFNKFLGHSMLDINTWNNVDMLYEECESSDEIFSLVLSGLPIIGGMPLRELLLQRDVYGHPNPIPAEMAKSDTPVFFPFYFHISSLIDMALDKANSGSPENGMLSDLSISTVLESVDAMMGTLVERTTASSLSIDESMVAMVRSVVYAVEASNELFERYAKQILMWKYGIRHPSQTITWISNKMKDCRQNIIVLHMICQKNAIGLVRMSSWSLVSDPNLQAGVGVLTVEGNSKDSKVVAAMLDHFKASLSSDAVDLSEWSRSFSSFMHSIPDVIGDETTIKDVATITVIRQLAFASALVDVGAPQGAVTAAMQGIDTPPTLCNIYRLLDDNSSAGEGEYWVVAAKEKLLRTFLAPWWLQSISDIDGSDSNFLIATIKGEPDYHQIGHQMAVVHLRNLLLFADSNGHDNAQFLPTMCFSQPVALSVNKSFTGQGRSDFTEETGQRKGMPHYIPAWLRSANQQETANAFDGGDLAWYFKNHSHSSTFDCPLADVTFDVVLGLLATKASDHPSEQLLLAFEQAIHSERSVSLREHTRRARQKPGQKETASFVGSSLGAIELSALLVCLVCKIADELSKESQATALIGMNPEAALSILESVMAAPKWSEFFFSTILRLRGDDHLASLLGEGGALNNFGWCERWKDGISSLQQNVVQELREANASHRQAVEDTDRFRLHYRACPHCRGLFGEDARNCGQFTCGRDAHGVNGGPAVGGQAVRQTFGCGQTFSIAQSLPYEQSSQYREDQAALRQLGTVLEEKQRAFDAFNQSAELWRNAGSFITPCLTFQVNGEHTGSMFPRINLVDHMPEEGANSSTRLLVNMLRHIPLLEHVPYLPDMIEVYIFIHKSFRHVVTKEMAMNMKICDVMDGRLLSERFGSIDGSHIQRVWSRAAEGVNAFLAANDSRVRWNCEEVLVPFDDLRNVPLISILSEMSDPTEGNDYLFLIINEIILRFNNSVKSVSTLANSNRSGLQRAEEINPRTIVCQSKASIVVIGSISRAKAAMDTPLIESYWIVGERRFDVQRLSDTIRNEMNVVGQLQPIKSPASFLREKFAFRDTNANAGPTEDASDGRVYSTDGLFFTRNEDLALYEDVRESANNIGLVPEGTCIRHTTIVTFHTFSHEEWTSLLEGLRNLLCHRDEFELHAILNEARGTTNSLQRFGFPTMDNAQTNLLSSMSSSDVMGMIRVCGEQLSSEAYRFVGIPSKLSEPMSQVTVDSMRDGIERLLLSQSACDIIAEISSFCEEVLDFYCDRLIVPESETSNEGLTSFLTRNNCCDESDIIFKTIPKSATLRHFVDVQKQLQQAKLKLILDSGEYGVNPSIQAKDTMLGQHEDNQYRKGLQWKWGTSYNGHGGSEDNYDKYHWKAFGSLWFEDAVKAPEDADASCSDSDEEKKEDTSVSNDGISSEKEDIDAARLAGDSDPAASLMEDASVASKNDTEDEDAATEVALSVDQGQSKEKARGVEMGLEKSHPRRRPFLGAIVVSLIVIALATALRNMFHRLDEGENMNCPEDQVGDETADDEVENQSYQESRYR